MSMIPAETDFTPGLIRCFAALMRLRGRIVSSRSLLSGLTGSAVTPKSCLSAARKAGLSARIVSKPEISDIPGPVLPCILLLKDDRSCVLKSIRNGQVEVIYPELDSPRTLPLDKLQEDYAGAAIFGAFPEAEDSRMESPKITRGKRWFWDVIGHYAPIYRHVAVASIVINLVAVASPLFVMNVYDRVVPNNATATLWVLASGIALIYVFNLILSNLRTHFVDVAGRNADVILSSVLVEKVLSMRLDAKPESTGAMVNNLREFEHLREFFSSSSILALIDLPFLVVFLLLIWFLSGPMVFVPLGIIPIILAIGILAQTVSRRNAERGYRQNMQKNALLTELVGGLETIKACGVETRMRRLWEAVAGLSAKSSSDVRRWQAMAVSASMFVTQLATVAMIIWGVYRIGEGLMSMGALIGVNILLGRTMAPLLQLANLLTRFQNSRMTLKALDMIMALPSENASGSSCVDAEALEPEIRLENVAFTYPHGGRPALKDVSLVIRPGERVGVIGAMGSGKSSLARVILGLYEPQEGSVRYGGTDIRQLPAAELRSRVGVLPQDVVLFYGTIRENIALGDPSLTDGHILRAASLAGVTDFIADNPDGFAAQAGEQGKALSGGQRQAVALARALVHDPEILVLDEPTSDMDTGSEHRLQMNLAKIIEGRTLILITHRMSMLAMVDRIIVMDRGHVVMDGPKNTVLKALQGGNINGK